MTTATRPRNGHATHPVPAPRPALDSATLEAVVATGDLSKLNSSQRLSYYYMRCEAAGLDPRARPFEYITLSDKLILYATKACTDQLIAAHKLAVSILGREHDHELGCYVVQCRVSFPDGRTVDDVGVVSLANLRGDAMANAVMKATTKAKRRTVLSACGLGMLDESEVETIPGARIVAEPAPTAAPAPEPPRARGECSLWIQSQCDDVENEWATLCATHHKPHHHLGDGGKRINVWQVINGVVTAWIAEGYMPEETVLTNGKRDRAKVKAVIKTEWDTEPQEFCDDVRGYLLGKLEAAAAAAGINLDAEPEDTADAAQSTA